MVYRGGPKRAALFVRAVAVVAPSLQGGIFDSRGGGLQTGQSVPSRNRFNVSSRAKPRDLLFSLNAVCPCLRLSSRIPVARSWRTQVRDLLFAFPPFPTTFLPASYQRIIAT